MNLLANSPDQTHGRPVDADHIIPAVNRNPVNRPARHPNRVLGAEIRYDVVAVHSTEQI